MLGRIQPLSSQLQATGFIITWLTESILGITLDWSWIQPIPWDSLSYFEIFRYFEAIWFEMFGRIQPLSSQLQATGFIITWLTESILGITLDWSWIQPIPWGILRCLRFLREFHEHFRASSRDFYQRDSSRFSVIFQDWIGLNGIEWDFWASPKHFCWGSSRCLDQSSHLNPNSKQLTWFNFFIY